MITINLLKKTSSKRGGTGVGVGRVLIAGILGLAVVVVGAGLMRWWIEHPRLEQPRIEGTVTAAAAVKTEPEKKPVAVLLPEPEKKPVAAAPQPAPEKKRVPAIASVPPLLPEKKAPPEAAPLPPEPAPRAVDAARKISNDIAFVKNVLGKLTEAAPEGIGFGTLSIDSFSTVTGVGTAATRELVSSFFLNLRREQLNVLGHPDSYIGHNDGEGYSFVFVCKPSFGDAPTGPLRSRNNLVSRNRLPKVIKMFSKTAARNHLFLQKGLSRKAVKKTGGYVHNVYRLSCSGTYRNFIAFVLELDQARMLCAFAAVRLSARSAAAVDISADVDFISRE
jgi:hypothetical protein